MNPGDTPERAFDDDFDRLERYREALVEIVRYQPTTAKPHFCHADTLRIQHIAAEALDPKP